MFTTLLTAAAIASSSPFGELQHTRVDEDVCKQCVSIGTQGLQQLINAALNVGIVGGCGKLCSALPNPNEAKACDVGCTLLGIKAFEKILNKADLDPIYYCELLKACPAGADDASISVDRAVVSPASGPVGTAFAIQLQFTTINATGVGEVETYIKSPQGAKVGSATFLNSGFKPGKYASNVTFTPKNDYTKSPPLIWEKGTYEYGFRVCQGACGSTHPHSKIFGETKGTLEITA